MKKKILSLFMAFVLMSMTVVAYNGEMPGMSVMPADTDAKYEPYYEDLNVLRYTPWFKVYHMQTSADYANGNHGGEGGQVIMTLAVSPVNSDHVLMGSDKSGGWRSLDGGKNWRIMDNNVNTWAVVDAKWDPVDGDTAYIVESFSSTTFDKHGKSTIDGLYKTTDAGTTWTQVNEFNYVAGVGSENLIYFDGAHNLYTLSSDGVYKSEDGGSNWTRLGRLVYDEESNYYYNNAEETTYTVDDKQAVFSMYVSKDGQTIAVATKKGLFVTYDGGAVWNIAGSEFNGITTYSISVDTSNDKHWVAVASGSKVYTSTDSGKTWKTMNFVKYTNGKYYPVFTKFTQPKADGKPSIIMIFDDMNAPYRYCTDGTRTSFYTTEGLHWKSPTYGPNRANRFLSGANGYSCEGLAVSESDPNLVYYSFGDIIYKSTDGGKTFDVSCSGFSGNNTNQYLFDDDGRIWFAFTDKGLGVTDYAYDGKKLPTAHMNLYGGTASSVVIDPNDKNHMFTNLGGWAEQQLYETKDGGANWTKRSDVPSKSLGGMKYINDTTIVCDSYTSKDNGVTWVTNSNTYTSVSNLNPNIIYSSNGKGYYRSTDGGVTWEKYDSPNNSTIYEMVADEFDSSVVWIGTYSGHVFKVSFDSEGKATTVNNGNGIPYKNSVFQVSVTSIAQNPNNSKHLVAGGKATVAGVNSYGIVETIDGGDNWYVVPGSVGPMDMVSLTFSPVSNEVFIGTCSNGTIVYEYDNYTHENVVKFDNNGVGGGRPANLKGKYGDTVTLPDILVKRSGYNFAGWEYTYQKVDVPTGTLSTATKIYQPGDTFTVQYKDVTLKAVWVEKEKSAFYDNSGKVIETLNTSDIKGKFVPENYKGTALPVIGVYYKETPWKMVKFVSGNSVDFSKETSAECTVNLTGVNLEEVFLKMFLVDNYNKVTPIDQAIVLE